MATHPSVLALETPQTREPVGLQSMKSQMSWTLLSSYSPLPPGAQPRSEDKAVPLMQSMLHFRMKSREGQGIEERTEVSKKQ